MSIIDRFRELFGGKQAEQTAVMGGSVAATDRDDSPNDVDSSSGSGWGGGDSGGSGGDGGGGT